jgi:hypothetical protein
LLHYNKRNCSREREGGNQPSGKQNCIIISRLYYCLIVPLRYICGHIVIYHCRLNTLLISSHNNDMAAVETSRVILLKLLGPFATFRSFVLFYSKILLSGIERIGCSHTISFQSTRKQ